VNGPENPDDQDAGADRACNWRSVRRGHNVDVDYSLRTVQGVGHGSRMLDDLTGWTRSQTELRSLLGSFLFSEDDVFKKIGVLSGGERNRYALARMLRILELFTAG